MRYRILSIFHQYKFDNPNRKQLSYPSDSIKVIDRLEFVSWNMKVNLKWIWSLEWTENNLEYFSDETCGFCADRQRFASVEC